MKLPEFIKHNLLFKVTSANTALVLVRMGFSLITQKVLAILVGAEGIALVGNLKNVVVFFEQFTILGTSNGLVKYISEYKEDKDKLNKLTSTALVFTTIGTVISFLLLFFFSKSLNDLVFGAYYDFAFAFKILAFIIPFMGVNALLYALLNGLSDYKLYSKTALCTIIFSAFLIVWLTYTKGLNGSIMAIALIPLLQFISYLVFYSTNWLHYFRKKQFTFSLSFKNQLLSYSVMSIVSIVAINFTDIAIRNLIEAKLNIVEAGHWTAMTSISKTYMQFLAGIFPLYILPKYSKVVDSIEFRTEVENIYKMLLPLLVLGLFLIYILRNLIIKLLYTDEFLVIEDLFMWQLIGDLIKFIALVLSYLFLAKRKAGYFIFTEVFSVLLFYGISIYFIDSHGIEGVAIAHTVRFTLYLLMVLIIFRNDFKGNKRLFGEE